MNGLELRLDVDGSKCPEVRTRRSGNILVIDDKGESLMSLVRVLAADGYHVQPVGSGLAAITAASTAPPDLILIDIEMSDPDAIEVCRRLKTEKTNGAIPVVLLDAAHDPKRRVAGLAAGAVDVISKPFLKEELLARINNHLLQGRSRRDLEGLLALRTAELRDVLSQLPRDTVGRATAGDFRRKAGAGFPTLSDTMGVLMWRSAPDQSYTDFNAAWLQYRDRSKEQEIGSGWTEGVHPDDLPGRLTAQAAAFDARRAYQAEYRLQRGTEYRWVLENAWPQFEADGSFIGYLGVCVDITDFKREQAKNIRVLVGGIAHDFGNLMSSIQATADLADEELGRGISPVGEIEIIKNGAKRAVDFIHELTIYLGQDQGTFRAVDLSSIVDELISLLKPSISDRATFVTDVPANLPRVWGNPTHLRQLVMNLIMNAADALSGTGGLIRISASTAPRPRSGANSASALLLGDYVRLEISDSGRGMSEEEKAKMFDLFFTTKRAGHGLGLAVVRRIVQSHGGSINAITSPGRGTTFEVLLPSTLKRAGKVAGTDEPSAGAPEVRPAWKAS